MDRDALLQFTDPHTVQLAIVPGAASRMAGAAPGEDEDEEQAGRLHTRSQRLLRTLVEDTALLYADLHPIDAEYARGQRSWLAGQAADMTGGTVEVREDEYAFAIVAKQMIRVFRVIFLKRLDVRAIGEKNVRPAVFVVVKHGDPARHCCGRVRSLECLVGFNAERQALQREFDFGCGCTRRSRRRYLSRCSLARREKTPHQHCAANRAKMTSQQDNLPIPRTQRVPAFSHTQKKKGMA